MHQRHAIGVLLIALVLALGLGWAVYTGVGPAPGDNSGTPITDFPTADPPNDSTGSDSGGSPTAAFSFTVEAVEECGVTCRDVTATLHNYQNTSATGVTVFIRIYAGENNTQPVDVVWEDRIEVGTLAAGSAVTTTERVELSLRDARKVNRRDGWITIVTAVQTDDQTVTFQHSERVA